MTLPFVLLDCAFFIIFIIFLPGCLMPILFAQHTAQTSGGADSPGLEPSSGGSAGGGGGEGTGERGDRAMSSGRGRGGIGLGSSSTAAACSSSSQGVHRSQACLGPGEGFDDEDEPLREQLRAQRLLQALRIPGMRQDHGLTAPPTSITPLTMDAYSKAFRPW
jgi:hypothetical protein